MQQFQLTAGNKLRDIRAKSLIIIPAATPSEMRSILDVDHRLAGSTAVIDDWKNYQGDDFAGAEAGRAIAAAIAEQGLSITVAEFAQLLNSLPRHLAMERIAPTGGD